MRHLAERFEVPLGRLIQMEQAEKELKRARQFIKRLQAENRVLKEEKRELITRGNRLLMLWAKISKRTGSFIPPLWAWNFNNYRQL